VVRLGRGRKPPIKDLIVLCPQKDPFYAGTETQQAMAEWFADVLGQATGAHLRRIHYRLVARGDVVRADGVLYGNNKNSWAYLNNASRFARYLGLADPEDLVDWRNPSPHIHMAPGFGFGPEWSYELDTNRLDRIHTQLGNPSWRSLIGVESEVDGYLYEESLQPYHVEVWAEKTTMNDILVPLCSSLGANYVSGAGYQSITAMVKSPARACGRASETYSRAIRLRLWRRRQEHAQADGAPDGVLDRALRCQLRYPCRAYRHDQRAV
jgi:hypothetical protein